MYTKHNKRISSVAAHDMPTTLQPNVASVRSILAACFISSADLNAFCVDYFPDVYRRFSSEMERTTRENLLLSLVSPDDILVALQKANPPLLSEEGRRILKCSALNQDEERLTNQHRLTRKLTKLYRAIALGSIMITLVMSILGWTLWKSKLAIETQRRIEQIQLAQIHIEQGRQELTLKNSSTRALVWFNEALRLGYDSPELRLMLGIAINDLSSQSKILQSGKEIEKVTNIKITEDGQSAITSAFSGEEIKIWDLVDGKLKHIIRKQGRVVDISGNGHRLITQAEGGYYAESQQWINEPLKAWETSTGRLMSVLQNSALSGASIGPEGFSEDNVLFSMFDEKQRIAKVWNLNNGKEQYFTQKAIDCRIPLVYLNSGKLLCGIFENNQRIFDLKTGTVQARFGEQGPKVQRLWLSSDGRQALTVANDKVVHLWDAINGQKLFSLVHDQQVKNVGFSNAGGLIWSTSPSGLFHIWQRNSGKHLIAIHVHESSINATAFNHDDTELLTAGDSEIRLWSTHDGQLLADEHVVFDEIALGFRDKTPLAITLSDEGTLALQNLRRENRTITIQAHPGVILAAVFSQNGERLATVSKEKVIKIWNTTTGELIRSLPESMHAILDIAFNSKGSYILSGGEDNSARIWEVGSGIQVYSLEHELPVYRVQFSPDDTKIFTMSDRHRLENNIIVHTLDTTDKKVGIAATWDANSKRLLHSVAIYGTQSGAFSSNGSQFFFTDMDMPGHAIVQNAMTGTVLFSHTYPRGQIDKGSFSPDGLRIVLTGTQMQQTQILNLATGNIDVSLDQAQTTAYSATFSPDGKFVLTSHLDKSMKIWDANNGRLLASMTKHVGPAAISPDGTKLLTCSNNGLVTIRDINVQYQQIQRLSNWIACHVPYRVESGRLVLSTHDPSACHRL